MQSTVKFFEMPAQSGIGGACSKKVAVKMSAKDAAAIEDDAGRFAEMMAALMALPTDGIAQSLPKVGWGAAEEGAKEWVPLIDLSNSDGAGPNMVQMLMKDSKNGNVGHTLFHLKLKLHPEQQPAEGISDETTLFPADELGDIQAAALDQAAAETVADMAKADPKAASGLKIPPPLSAKGEQTATVEIPELNLGPKMQKGLEKEIEGIQPKIDPHKDTADLQAHPGMTRAEEPALSETIRTALTKESQKSENAATEPKGQAQTAIHDLVSQGAKNAGTDTDLMKGQDHHRRSAEGADRQHVRVDSDALFNASSDASGTTGATANQTATMTNAGDTSFHNQLKTIATDGTRTPGAEANRSPDSQEMQTDVIRQIVQRMTMRADGHTSQMQVKLKPEFLGNMHVDIMTENQQVMIRMTAENHRVKEIIEQNIHVLRAEMQQHGLHVQKIDVYVSQDQDSWKNGQPQTAFQQAHERGRQQGRYQGGRRESGSGAETAWSAMEAVAKDTGGKTSEVDFFA